MTDNAKGKNLFLRSTYAYDLPDELIAQTPSERRDGCRMLVVHRDGGRLEHRTFSDLPEYLRPGDCLVINDTKVIPARLFGTAEGRPGTVETVLLKRDETAEGEVWQALTRPGKKTRPGQRIRYSDELSGEVVDVGEGGVRVIRFDYDGIFMEILDRIGMMPLPPYITKKLEDGSLYQTVDAKINGSAAAPTAGLHFTPELLETLQAKGVKIARVLLHVGLGTFRPVKEDDIRDHAMHREFIRVTEEAAETINGARRNGGRIVAVGTTSARTLESAAGEDGTVRPYEGETGIFLYPGKPFHAVDALITNFHLPESTLIMLVAAFAGYDLTMKAYRTAVAERYRFFSFGDSMLLL
ncbi:MAG: tRNA preQ1(34) S-adenosylmethionine ribosyltransferase-isomerase QueA [Clostridia bacterium]|nr:tRNA preQ1(34) S-adenosylmethionine ribosyltransferase-isomerase QueA [Clostridia bacterium]